MTAIHADSAPSDTAYATVRKGRKVDRRLARYLCLNDFEETARRRLPRMLYGFISGGAETNASVRSNTDSFKDYCFVPRVLTDVSRRSHRKQLRSVLLRRGSQASALIVAISLLPAARPPQKSPQS
jgi:L-lactate dehydrogenase (cytochrome)